MDNHTLAAVIALSKKYAGEITSNISDDIAQNVTDWLDNHVDPETGYVIDDTLTIQGAAADAKKTGDELTDLKNELTQFQETGYVHFDPADFQVGGIDTSTGDIVSSHTKRVVMTDISTAAYDMTIRVDTTHKMMIAYYTNNVFDNVSDWKTNNSIAINKGQQYRVVIADYPTETASTSVEEKVSGLSCTSIFSNLLSCVASENEAWG